MKEQELKKILIVDDESNTRQALVRYFRGTFAVTEAENGEIAINLLQKNDYDLILTDLRMPGADGISVLEATLGKANSPKCIVLTAYGSVEKAVEAVKKGAFDFLTKPLKLDKLEAVINKALEADNHKLETPKANASSPKIANRNVLFNSPKMQEILDEIKIVAPSKTTLLITGESGSGKEVVANLIHKYSERRGLFIPVHCAALADNLLESELFGHEKGAFTGANELRKGRFELADGGTLFLDEIGEISHATQVKLLRVLETRKFERVGGSEIISTDVRLVAATNKNLFEMVKSGEFREDLYYRLNVVNIELPPLRERKEDVEGLTLNFIEDFARENNKLVPKISSSAMEKILAYNFPGNVRELKNCIERIIVFNQNQSEITVDDLPENILNYNETQSHEDIETKESETISILEDTEKDCIMKTLNEVNNNRTLAAEKLGISRRTLQRRLKDYGIN